MPAACLPNAKECFHISEESQGCFFQAEARFANYNIPILTAFA
jgi:hypothetical protein